MTEADRQGPSAGGKRTPVAGLLSVVAVGVWVSIFLWNVADKSPPRIGRNLTNLAAAQRFAEHLSFRFVPPEDVLCHFPYELVTRDGHTFWPKYAPGYPFLLALLSGLNTVSSLVANFLAALLLVGSLCIIAGRLLSPRYLLGVVLLLLTLPSFNYYCFFIHSDLAAAALGAVALAALVEFTYSADVAPPPSSRRTAMAKSASPKIRWALFAAAFLVLALSTRYLYAIFVLPGLLTIAAARRRPPILAFAGGLLAFAVPLLLYHSVAFGSPFSTGYALTNEQTAFHPLLIPQGLRALFQGQPVMILLTLLASAAPLVAARSPHRRVVVLLATWMWLSLAFHASFWWATEASFTGPLDASRFLLPSLVATLVCATYTVAWALGKGEAVLAKRSLWVRRSALSVLVLGLAALLGANALASAWLVQWAGPDRQWYPLAEVCALVPASASLVVDEGRGAESAIHLDTVYYLRRGQGTVTGSRQFAQAPKPGAGAEWAPRVFQSARMERDRRLFDRLAGDSAEQRLASFVRARQADSVLVFLLVRKGKEPAVLPGIRDLLRTKVYRETDTFILYELASPAPGGPRTPDSHA